jgi:hypothetical protein
VHSGGGHGRGNRADVLEERLDMKLPILELVRLAVGKEYPGEALDEEAMEEIKELLEEIAPELL